MFRPSWEPSQLLPFCLSDCSEMDLDMGPPPDFVRKEKNTGRENGGRRLKSEVGTSVSGVLYEPSRVRGDSVTRSLESMGESC